VLWHKLDVVREFQFEDGEEGGCNHAARDEDCHQEGDPHIVSKVCLNEVDQADLVFEHQRCLVKKQKQAPNYRKRCQHLANHAAKESADILLYP